MEDIHNGRRVHKHQGINWQGAASTIGPNPARKPQRLLLIPNARPYQLRPLFSTKFPPGNLTPSRSPPFCPFGLSAFPPLIHVLDWDGANGYHGDRGLKTVQLTLGVTSLQHGRDARHKTIGTDVWLPGVWVWGGEQWMGPLFISAFSFPAFLCVCVSELSYSLSILLSLSAPPPPHPFFLKLSLCSFVRLFRCLA